MRAFPDPAALGYPVVYDVTHSLQLPGAGDGVTAGQAEFIEPMASAGVAAGVDGVFMEVHEEPAAGEERRAERAPARSARGAARSGSFASTRSSRPRSPVSRMNRARSPASISRARCCASRRRRSSASSIASTATFEQRGPAPVRVPRPRHRHRHGQVRASSAGRSPRRSRAPARPRGSCTRPKPSTAISARFARTTWCMALSHSGETEELLRLLESIRRIGARLIALTGHPDSTLGAGSGRDARLRHRRRGLPDEPGPDREHDGGAGAGRRAGHDAARPQGLPRRAVRVASSGRQDRAAPDAGRARHALRATPRPSCAVGARCPKSFHEMSSKRLGMTCVVDDERTPGGRLHRRRPAAADGARVQRPDALPPATR